jgi:hypothetical protein
MSLTLTLSRQRERELEEKEFEEERNGIYPGVTFFGGRGFI